jgi:hypothetical protein
MTHYGLVQALTLTALLCAARMQVNAAAIDVTNATTLGVASGAALVFVFPALNENLTAGPFYAAFFTV